MNYSIRYSSSDVLEQIFNLPISLQARYIALTQRMIEYGPHLGLPHTDSFGGGLFELRLKGAEGIARVFFCTLVEREIVMLHSFIKKSQKTPDRELKLAKLRMKELKL
ncbi:type II toxin-antitoxin system RelE/ParE family toxin [Polynucleobacter sp. 78F-HAINBA]|jgi:phage-related protein|uniref:type II toxin-antitoxin system RelE/ParE family toxin n=1 Tax=Polynucleobacter sp. 78F-HAINBA TaxID=2689099 RepID=UPI001C0CB381|nr:type II toxin-antitoxin system RelE/ParE family toxin [Polynucleobacter sp. 78F-HAINBA]MBU3591166.1 type II toxin-antitoxin system RelE/ParE family toxin [Polynucleobacter sp. 78F-HAINBA]